jgi:hypothetical protein
MEAADWVGTSAMLLDMMAARVNFKNAFPPDATLPFGVDFAFDDEDAPAAGGGGGLAAATADVDDGTDGRMGEATLAKTATPALAAAVHSLPAKLSSTRARLALSLPGSSGGLGRLGMVDGGGECAVSEKL